MITRSTLLHLRFPFSWFLLPVFMMALAVTPSINWYHAVVVFIVFHLFLYTASNGFNSYYDRDEGSIGGLRVPPPVTADLLWWSLVFDAAGIALALLVSWQFTAGVFSYVMASKIYSWKSIRIKKYGWLSWLFVGVGQGTLVFLLTIISVSEMPEKSIGLLTGKYLVPAISAGFFLLGIFPLTQIYQHDEDARRNDMTLSRILGIQKTFYCAAMCMVAAIAGFFYYFYSNDGIAAGVALICAILPAVLYFVQWFIACRNDPGKADFTRTMRMNVLASSGVNLFGLAMLFMRNQW